MGYGISGGKDFIWVVLPFVSTDGQHHQRQWWGDPDQTTKYCLEVAESLPKLFHADPDRYVLCGFSRGAIACNYIGLRNDRIAKLWKAMICHSHYDGVLKWNYPDSDFRSALNRLRRLKTIPQFICQEKTTKPTQTYLEKTKIAGSFTFLDLPFANHTDRWLLKDLPERKRLRQWLTRVLKD